MNESEAALTMSHAGLVEDSPFGIESKKLVMWLFIVADAATFGAMLFVYGYLRVGSSNWIKPFNLVPTILNGTVMTVILLTSSLTMLAAVRAAQAGVNGRTSCLRWLAVTGVLGTAFAALHLREWFGLIADGWSPTANPTGGSPLFGGAFFGITGLHLLHVICGLVAILVISLGFRSGRLTPAHVETTGLYWHFVDLVWMFVFPLVYLLNAR